MLEARILKIDLPICNFHRYQLTVARSFSKGLYVLICGVVIWLFQMKHVQPALVSAESNLRRAAFISIAVSAEGCADHMRTKLVDFAHKAMCILCLLKY